MPEYGLPKFTRRGRIKPEDIKSSDIFDWMKEVVERSKEAPSKKRSLDYRPKDARYPIRE